MYNYAEKYITQLKKNEKRYNNQINKTKKNRTNKNISKLKNMLVKGGIGIYSCSFLENYYLDIAAALKIELPNEYRCKSILHVMTESYNTGGHTRVVERWIDISPSDEVHSVLLTKQNKENVPLFLEKVVQEKKGEIIDFPKELSNIEKAGKIRQIASKYEKIVLHIHMDDEIPLIAFGTKEFKRPVIFYNHADHIGWIGVSIADIVADLREYGRKITLEKRKPNKSFKLGIPILKSMHSCNKTRKELQLPNDKIIILTYGYAPKYNRIDDLNIGNVINNILERHKNVVFCIIGVKAGYNKYIDSCAVKFSENIILKDAVEHKILLEYINASDIVLDSFPMSGATAMLDACFYNKPIVSGCSLVGQLDYIMNSGEYCNSIDEIIHKLEELILSNNTREINVTAIQKSLAENDSINKFTERLQKLYEILPKEHNIYRKENEITINDYSNMDVYRLYYDRNIHSIIQSKYFKLNIERNTFGKWVIITLGRKDFRFKYK